MFLFASLKFVPHKKPAANRNPKNKHTMPQQIINELETALDETVNLLSSFSEKELNTVPFKGSWTAAQVGRHLFKSEDGIDKLFAAPTKPVNRPPDANAGELKKTFLDFNTKMKSPDFIVPEDIAFDKDELVESLANAKEKVLESVKENNLAYSAELPEDHPLAGSTKLEIVHFITYHTIRHNHQIKKIRELV